MQNLSVNQYLKNHIRTVPDWPAPGVLFRDITPLLRDAKVHADASKPATPFAAAQVQPYCRAFHSDRP